MKPMQALSALALAAAFSLSPIAMAKGHSGTSSVAHTSHAKSTTALAKAAKAPKAAHSSSYAQGVKRDSHGKIARSQSATNDFKKQHPFPSIGKSSGACPGYVIDHVKPLKRGGADDPSNIQRQTKAAVKQKDSLTALRQMSLAKCLAKQRSRFAVVLSSEMEWWCRKSFQKGNDLATSLTFGAFQSRKALQIDKKERLLNRVKGEGRRASR